MSRLRLGYLRMRRSGSSWHATRTPTRIEARVDRAVERLRPGAVLCLVRCSRLRLSLRMLQLLLLPLLLLLLMSHTLCVTYLWLMRGTQSRRPLLNILLVSISFALVSLTSILLLLVVLLVSMITILFCTSLLCMLLHLTHIRGR